MSTRRDSLASDRTSFMPLSRIANQPKFALDALHEAKNPAQPYRH
jgi:hypothetical protein